MSEAIAPIYMMLMLIVGIASGLPFAFVIGASAIISTILFWGYHALPQMVFQTYKVLENFAFIAIPLFVLMAMILHKARLAEEMYDMMYKWSGPLRGGLAIGTEFICAVFAACTGIAGGTETAMGLVALPSMLKYKYAKSIALGSILTGGTLGQLIPPSILIVLYGIVTNVSVGKMFAGGLAAGIVLVGLYSAYIFIRALINKDLCPALASEERANWKEKFISLKNVILPMLLIIMVLGSIFTGTATPTEAAGVGVLGALISAALRGRLNRQLISEATIETLKVSSMIGWILVAASAFTNVFIIGGGDEFVSSILTLLPGGKWGVLVSCMILLFILGMIVEVTAILLICGPLFAPIMAQLGFNEVWFGILFMVQMQIAYISPPFGYSIFYLYAVAPPEIGLVDMYKASLPFMGMQVIGLAIFIIWPSTILWLPNLLMK